MKSFLNSNLILACTFLLNIASSQSFAANSAPDNADKTSPTCNIEDTGFATLENLINFEETTLHLPIMSTEGNAVNIYKNAKQIVALKLDIYGETGGSIYTYLFNSEQLNKTLIKVRDFNYSLPVFDQDFNENFQLRRGIATETKTVFIICEGYPKNYLGNEHIDNLRTEAINYLTLIRQSLLNQQDN